MQSQGSRAENPEQGIKNADALASVIRETRKKHHLTQAELAGLSGTGLRFIHDLERGKPTVSLAKVLAVLAVLGLRLHLKGQDT
jgi:HTH-type transcriptional regulator / antitoxin HipB